MKNIVITGLLLLVFWGCTKKKPQINSTSKTSESWAFKNFEKVDSLNPILKPSLDLHFECPITKNQIFWESRNVLNPSAVVKGDTIFLFYRAQDSTGISRIGLAHSLDGLHFEKSNSPVFYPDNDSMKKWNGIIENFQKTSLN
jgi:hypothetical protein